MSTPPPYPQSPYPRYQAYPPPPKRRSALPWLIVGGLVVVAALVVTLVLVLGGDDDSESGSGSDAGTGDASPDLSTPEKAAEAVAAAATSGDVEAFLELTCVGTPRCAEEYGEDATQEDITAMRETIEAGLPEFADQLEGAEFGEATEASEPGAMEVRYTTPDMGEDEFRALMFVEVDGSWFWFGSAGGGVGGGGPPTSGSSDETPSEAPPTTTFSCPPPPTATGPFPVPSIPGC